MNTIICTKYRSRDVLQLQAVKKTQPKANEVLVKSQTASVNAGGWHLMRTAPFLIRLVLGLRKPKHAIHL